MSSQLLVYWATILIWGSTWFAIRFQLGTVSPDVSVAYRFSIASILLFIWCFFKKGRMKYSWTDHGFLALQGLLMFSVNYQLGYLANAYLTSGINAVVFSTVMIFNIFNSALFYKKGITLRTAVGSSLGILGITTVFWPELTSFELSSGPIIGILCSIGNALLASLGNMVCVRNQSKNLPITETNAYAMGYGAILSYVLLILRGSSFTFEYTWTYVASLVYLSIFGSIVAFGCYLKLLSWVGAQRAAYALILTPIVALLISTFFENYAWTPEALIGVVLILGGNFLVLSSKKGSKNSKDSQAEPKKPMTWSPIATGKT